MSKIWRCKHCKEQFLPAQVLDKKQVVYTYQAKGLDQVVLKSMCITEVLCVKCNDQDKKKG